MSFNNKEYLGKVSVFKMKLLHLKRYRRNNMIILRKSKIRILSQVIFMSITDLIKRFLSKLKTPIIPYNIFEQLMNTPNLSPEYIG